MGDSGILAAREQGALFCILMDECQASKNPKKIADFATFFDGSNLSPLSLSKAFCSEMMQVASRSFGGVRRLNCGTMAVCLEMTIRLLTSYTHRLT